MTSQHDALAPGWTWRKWKPRVVGMATLLGAAVFAALVTGGIHHTTFWLGSWIVAVLSAFALSWCLMVASAIIWFPIWCMVRRRLKKWKDEIGASVGLILAAIFFVERAAVLASEAPADVAFPLGSPTAGFLLLSIPGIGLAFTTSYLSRPYRKAPRPPLKRQSRQLSGWRTWRVVDGVLVGMSGGIWESELMVASCPKHHQAPQWGCTCGTYAARSPNRVAIFKTPDPVVLGTVRMWGDVIEHEYGYRASHTRITDLWVGNDENLFLDLTVRYPNSRVWMGMPIVDTDPSGSDHQGEE